MNPWIAKAVILAASIVMVVIRAPHGRRNRGLKVARSCKGPREVTLLTLAWVGFIVPLIWVVSLSSPSPSTRFVLGRSLPVSCALWEGSGGFTGHIRTWAHTGRSPLNCARTIDSLRKGSTATSLIQCTRRCSFIPSAKRWCFRTGLRHRRTWWRLEFSSHFASAQRKG